MMLERVDPEVRAGLEQYYLAVGEEGFAGLPIKARREKYEELARELLVALAPSMDIATEDLRVPGPGGAPDLRLRIYRPANAESASAAVYVIHGGGMVTGSIETEELVAMRLCERLGCQVASVEYRLAPEHPFPAPQEDCYAGLAWLSGQAEELGIAADRIALFGVSAGAGLAASTALMARDRGGPELAFQLLGCPMLDDRGETPSSHEIVDLKVWDREANLEGWSCLLGDADPATARYASPARCVDLRGLPPTYVDVGELDGFRDEAIEYAARLLRAGIPTELFVYPGGVHGSQFFAPESRLGKEIVNRQIGALEVALALA